MKKKILMIMAVLAVLGIFSIAIVEIGDLGKNSDEVATSGDVAESETFTNGYSYSEVEELVSYLANTEEQDKALGRLIDPLTKSDYITISYIVDVTEIIGAPTDVYTKVFLTTEESEYVTKEQFDKIYANIVELGIVENLSRHNLMVYDVVASVSVDGTVTTQVFDGEEYHGLLVEVPSQYENQIIDVYMKNGDIFKINGLSDESIVFANAWLVSLDEDECTFLYNGMEKTYPISKGSTESDAKIDVTEGTIVKITLDNSGVIDIQEYKNTIRCKVYDVGNNVLELENIGTVPYSENMKIYDISHGDVAICEDSIPVLKGHSEVLIVRDGNTIIGAVIEDELVTRDIRVILSNNNYSSYKMSEITLSCDTSYTVEYSDDSESIRTAGKTITIKYSDYEAGDIITIKPTDASGRIQIFSLDRAYGNPIYEGSIEVRIFEDGLHIINEVPLETYLYSVVSSEMPSGSHPEALKAMAICARGYAYTKLEDGSFDSYDADLDDSTLCQVYNNVAETEESIKAVKDTYGIVPVYNDVLIVPLYFSTSCGTTCTNEDIWGGTAYPYLQSNLETLEKETIDLSEEETFVQFMKNSLGYDIIDKDMPYYRWSITFSTDDITNAVNSMLKERMSVSSEFIQEKDQEGNLHSTDITDIGQIKSIKVIERSTSGMVKVLEIEGTLATIQVSGQTNVRNIISPVNQEIVRQDGNVVTGWTSLPSPYYYIEANEEGYVIYGGGFGHGVGMSQSGAEVLAGQGYNYMYILRHYYSYIDFSSIYIIESKKDEE